MRCRCCSTWFTYCILNEWYLKVKFMDLNLWSKENWAKQAIPSAFAIEHKGSYINAEMRLSHLNNTPNWSKTAGRNSPVTVSECVPNRSKTPTTSHTPSLDMKFCVRGCEMPRVWRPLLFQGRCCYQYLEMEGWMIKYFRDSRLTVAAIGKARRKRIKWNEWIVGSRRLLVRAGIQGVFRKYQVQIIDSLWATE